jgi:antitoxin HicB
MRKSRKTQKNMGDTFDVFLMEEGIYEAVQTTAIKRILARQLADWMKKSNLTKVEMARRMRIGRPQLDRFLDPDNDSVTLAMLCRAAAAVGRELRIELLQAPADDPHPTCTTDR